MEKTILFVDDEKQILRAIKRLFMETDYIVFLADSGREALEILENEAVNMLITDIRMPKMNGYELLQVVKIKYPKVLRIAISGYTDNSQVYEALQKNLAKLYLFKPWDNDIFLKTVDNIFKFEDVLKNKQVLELINNLDNLPTIPKLYKDICDLIEKQESIDHITEKIEEDQAIVSKILQVSNSAFYGVRTGSVKSAILYLGLSNIKNIVLNNSVFDSGILNGFSRDLLWNHINITNKLVLIFFEKFFKKKLPETHQSAGLLHDIGIAVLLNNYKEKYFEIINMALEHEERNLLQLEKEILGITHQEIGGYLLNWWELPYPIVESALFHHNPQDNRLIYNKLVATVHIAECYSWRILGYDVYGNNLSKHALTTVGTTMTSCDNFFLEIERKICKEETYMKQNNIGTK